MSQSLARALDLLILLGNGNRSLDELAGLIGVHKTTVLRLLRTLEDERFVYHDGGHRYHLGSRFFALADASLAQRQVVDVAGPQLRALSRRTGGQTVHLAAYESGTVVYIDKVESTHAIRMYSRVGLPAALHCTAVGKVLVAALPERARSALLETLDYPRCTDNTITDRARYETELDLVRNRGWAYDHAEHEPFINCVGAPLHDADDRVVAAVSISVPDVILDFEQVLALVPVLLETTAAISRGFITTRSTTPRAEEKTR